MSGSREYSISLPENLAETVRAHAGPGGFSAHVAGYERIHRARIRRVLSRVDVHDVTADTADQAAARTAPVTALSGCGDGSPVGAVGRGEWS